MKKGVMSAAAASLLLVLALFVSCAGAPAPSAEASAPAAQSAVAAPKADGVPLDMAIFHVNDTHGKLESAYGEFRVDIDDTLKAKRSFVELGGFARLWTAVDELRAQYPNNLFVHAGDVFQGTLYFTQFLGAADRDFLNSMGLDAMTLGNHEFDKGPKVLEDFAAGASFPIVDCNLDLSAEPALEKLVKPYVIKNIAGARVAIIGIDTPDTPYISSPGPTVKFLDPQASIEKVVAELETQKIDKIILLSHQGYEEDLALAPKLKGVDVIIGGHSHTLLGDESDLGLKSAGPYPTVLEGADGQPVLVVTSWQWANAIGVLQVSFDAQGHLASWSGNDKFLAGVERFRIYDLPATNGKKYRVEFVKGADGSYSPKVNNGKAYADIPSAEDAAGYLAAFDKLYKRFSADPRFIFVADKAEGLQKLATYSSAVDALKAKIAGKAVQDLKRGNDRGPGPLIADSMRWKTGAQVAIMNPGGVRVDLPEGNLTVAQIYELQPFGNTLVTLNVSGADLIKVLEDMTDFCITSYGKDAGTAYAYVSGLRFTLMVSAAKGARVLNVQVEGADGAWAALDPAATYSLVVNNFMAGGGDKNFTLGALSDKYDTGFIDSEAMLDYVAGKELKNISESRIKNVM